MRTTGVAFFGISPATKNRFFTFTIFPASASSLSWWASCLRKSGGGVSCFFCCSRMGSACCQCHLGQCLEHAGTRRASGNAPTSMKLAMLSAVAPGFSALMAS